MQSDPTVARGPGGAVSQHRGVWAFAVSPGLTVRAGTERRPPSVCGAALCEGQGHVCTRRDSCSHHSEHHRAGADMAAQCHDGARRVIHGDTSPRPHHVPRDEGHGESLCRCSSDPKTREPRPKAVPKGSWSPWRTARLRGARAQSHGERGPPAAWGPDRAACLHSRHCRRPRPPSPWLLSAAQTASVSFLPSRTLCFVKHDPIVWEPLVPLNRMTVTLFIGRLL